MRSRLQRLFDAILIWIVAIVLLGVVAGYHALTATLATQGKIVFMSVRDGNAEIYVMDADGSNQTRLTFNPADDVSPSWSLR